MIPCSVDEENETMSISVVFATKDNPEKWIER